MRDVIPYVEQFETIVNIIETAKERAYRKVNEELNYTRIMKKCQRC